MNAFRKLKTRPDLLLTDGAGINHPRGAGLATHIGVALDVPTIGITKKILCGKGVNPVNVGEVSIYLVSRIVLLSLKFKPNIYCHGGQNP